MELFSPIARTVCVTNENITSLNLCNEPPVFNVTFPGIPTSPRPTTIATTTPSASWSFSTELSTPTSRASRLPFTLSTTILSTLSKFTTTESSNLSKSPLTPGVEKPLGPGGIAGTIFAVVFLIAIILLIVYLVYNRKHKKTNSNGVVCPGGTTDETKMVTPSDSESPTNNGSPRNNGENNAMYVDEGGGKDDRPEDINFNSNGNSLTAEENTHL